MHDADLELPAHRVDVLLEHVQRDVGGLLNGRDPRLRHTDAMCEVALGEDRALT
ncbi:MAG: hypothetical protein WD598_13430 [Acidimicrobiia bacterium]